MFEKMAKIVFKKKVQSKDYLFPNLKGGSPTDQEDTQIDFQ